MKNYLVYLCLLLFLNAVCGQSSRPPVRFEQGPVWFPDNLGQAAPAPDPAEIVNGRYVRFCQSETILLTEQRRRLETEGVGFIGYVDFGGYLISLPAGFDPERLQDAGIRSMTAVQTDWKMSRALQQPPYPAWARHPEGLIVQIQIYPHLSIPEGADACRKNGLTVLEEGNQNGWLLARIPFNRIQETAALPFVQYIDLAPAPPVGVGLLASGDLAEHDTSHPSIGDLQPEPDGIEEALAGDRRVGDRTELRHERVGHGLDDVAVVGGD
ncbi:MAG TPA: hypothetical protein PLW66_09785, partial [Saprospiraceae bacterium]|nr:hypothetical protein [Saprospiraceae bacterium]